jgi:alpha-N-arabinofuranosidase
VNTAAEPNAVAPKKGSGAAIVGGKLTLKLAPYSYQMIRIAA